MHQKKMGNEGSHLAGLEIDERIVEVTDGWTLHSGTVSAGNNPNISVFISETSAGNGGNSVILERAAKNLMLYRHPCILKYISSWTKSGRTHLATEDVKPLASVLSTQTPLQICIGLHNILKALVFLHEKALSSHNNVCAAAIYVTPDGSWKLGGMEYLCRFTNLTPSYLEETRARRYEKAVPPEEDCLKPPTEAIAHPMSIDQYGFGVLVEEILRKKSDADIPALQEFRDICKKQLQSSEPSLRPKLATLLDHVFFTHKFITIHSFLVELPLKTDTEKHEFFRSLVDQLADFPEKLVGMQLGALLLSRMVLLDTTAQQILLPQVLCPKQEDGDKGLFTKAVYREYVVPRLLQMFCVRDAQIRLLLLAHFSSFCSSFTEDQLRSLILPELLVGIKDTNEQLVSVTLRALADLVPVLGAASVVGGKRARLFTDGRPKARHHITKNSKPQKSPSRALPTPAPPAPVPDTDSTSFAADLPERPSPDGGEDHDPTSDDETEAWSDWDVPDNNVDSLVDDDVPLTVSVQEHERTDAAVSNKSELPDISQLDIKSSVSSVKTQDEYDFFQDMEPVISKTHILQLDDQRVAGSSGGGDVVVESSKHSFGNSSSGDGSGKVKSSKHGFSIDSTDGDGELEAKSSKHSFDVDCTAIESVGEGWGDDLDDWGEINEGSSLKS